MQRRLHRACNSDISNDTERPYVRAQRGKQFSGILFLAAFFSLLTVGSALFAQGPNFEWAKSMGGSNFDQAYAITVDNQGNSYTTGLFRESADFDPGPDSFIVTASTTGNTLFVSKLDAAGNFVWAKTFGGGGKFHNTTFSIAHDASGSVFVAGYYYGTVDFDPGPDTFSLTPVAATTADIFVLKLDSAGKFAWAKSVGGTNNDFAYGLTIDQPGNVYVTGRAFGEIDFNPGTGVSKITPPSTGGYAYILKLNADGEFVWAKDIGSYTRTQAVATGNSMVVDDFGNVYTTGSFKDSIDFDSGSGKAVLVSVGGEDVFVSKLDSTGNFVWAKSMGSNHTTRADVGLNVALDPDQKNVLITGSFNNTMDFDPGPDSFKLTTFSTQNSEIFILKLDTAGKFVWAKSITGATGSAFDHNFSFSTILDKAGNSYTTGYFKGFADFDPGSSNVTLTANGLVCDIFVLKLNPAGDYVWVKQITGSDISVARSSAFDGSGNMYTTGWIRGKTDFNPSTNAADTAFLTSKSNSLDIVVFKLTCGDTTSSILTDSADCNGYTLNDTTYMETGTYTQKRPNFVGCDSTITLHLTIIPKLDMDVDVTINIDVLGTADHYATYQWMLNGVLIPGATDSTYKVSENGDYRVIVSNERGCMDTSNIYTVNNTGIDPSYLAEQIQVYPNPTKDVIYIHSATAVNLSLNSIEGKMVKQSGNAKEISLSNLAEGIYFLNIYDLKGNLLAVKKVVKAE